MSTNIPFRAPRIHPQFLRRQCLFQRRQCLLDRPFSSTASRPGYRKTGRITDNALTRAAVEQQSGPAPKVNLQTASQNVDAMQEDIGVLQGTIVRAPFRQLASPLSWQFWSYFWNLVKSKGTGLYSRSHYRGCLQKSGWRRYLPVDVGNNAQLKERAKKVYVQMYEGFASGDISLLKSICLPPLTKQFENRITARGPLKMHWKLVSWKSARVVSHRAAAQNEDLFPDTSYRQAIIRLESVQTLRTEAPETSVPASSKRPHRWVPDEARVGKAGKTGEDKIGTQVVDNGTTQTVVEYLVLQRRVVRGKEEEWKVWGFTNESTPKSLERDEAYWRKALDANLTV